MDILYTKGVKKMQDQKLLGKAWKNLIRTLEDIRIKGEDAAAKMEEYDNKRRINGRIIEGTIAQYCRCGKKDCPELGSPGHSIRYHLQNAEGAIHIPKKELARYEAALDYNRLYHEAVRDIAKYERMCERSYKALGYVGRNMSFNSYLSSFIG